MKRENNNNNDEGKQMRQEAKLLRFFFDSSHTVDKAFFQLMVCTYTHSLCTWIWFRMCEYLWPFGCVWVCAWERTYVSAHEHINISSSSSNNNKTPSNMPVIMCRAILPEPNDVTLWWSLLPILALSNTNTNELPCTNKKQHTTSTTNRTNSISHMYNRARRNING